MAVNTELVKVVNVNFHSPVITGKASKPLGVGISIEGSRKKAQDLAEKAIEHFGLDNIIAVQGNKGKINLHVTNQGIKSTDVSNYLNTIGASTAYSK